MIYGAGRQSKDFIYVSDTARASLLAMKKWKPGDVYNVAPCKSTDFNAMFDTVKEEMKYGGVAKYTPNPLKSYQMFTQADISKTSRELGLAPQYDIRKDIREMLLAQLMIFPVIDGILGN